MLLFDEKGECFMKILFMSGNLTDGGAQRVISVATSYLADKGHDVTLLLYTRNEKEYPLSEKVKVLSLASSPEEYKKISEINRILLTRKLIKNTSPDVAIGFLEGGYGLFVSSFGMRFKKVSSIRSNPRLLWTVKGLRATIDKLWFHSSDAIIVQTESQVPLMKKRLRKKCTVIANPVSDEALKRAKGESEYENCKKIIMAGRLATQKDYPVMINAMKKVVSKYPDVTLSIFGKGPLEGSLQAMIEESGLSDNILLKGWTNNTLDEYAKSDMYVMSSYYEGMPNALVEAMAMGLPCVSTDCETGPSDIITDGDDGFLVPVKGVDALAERILQIIEMSPEERKTMGEKAHNAIKDKFLSSKILNQWEELFEGLLK
ncbi:MAG: glycosyltransferase family 4 protein [Ruminococcaceae bacterium]|nr:glycosyltransferase family 4 protein [Oscillospiraceae bacterium]